MWLRDLHHTSTAETWSCTVCTVSPGGEKGQLSKTRYFVRWIMVVLKKKERNEFIFENSSGANLNLAFYVISVATSMSRSLLQQMKGSKKAAHVNL